MNPYESIAAAASSEEARTALQVRRRRIFYRLVVIFTLLVLLSGVVGFFYARHWTHQAMRDALPQLDGAISIAGLSATVSVQRDGHGVPHLRASSLDDLVMAQAYVTAQDRLWQMDALRRHAAGNLAEILGAPLIPHDRAQRTLQIRAAADRALATLPADQLHLLERYSAGVNASIADQSAHLPLEFRLLRYTPAPWTPRDSLLIGLVMFQDLTNSFPQELNREALTARLPSHLVGDLYPVGSWRDHPPAQPVVDLTAPQQDIPDIPLDESQTKLRRPAPTASATATPEDLLALQETLKNPVCEGCFAGSGDWVVSGAHTATGKPLLSNDMHLTHNIPGIWYQADLEAPAPNGDLHVSGVSLPGVPFIIVGHNAHVAWGFTNLGAEVQDIYIEHTRGSGDTMEYQALDSSWHAVVHQQEIIHVKGAKDLVLDVPATQHGGVNTPIISGIFPSEKRSLSLRWTIYDPSNITPSFQAIDSATDGASLVAAFSSFGGPAQNLVYADDQGHIGYHAVGKIPIRGNIATPSPISPVPSDALDTTQDWAGTIPYEMLPRVVDPPNGILATANARVTSDDYPYPITLNWAAPYRNERIWKVLTARAAETKDHLTAADMLALQTDVYSDVDHAIAQRLAYAIDHVTKSEFTTEKTAAKRLHQAADLLRDWNGNVDADAAAPAIVVATRAALWPLLLDPQLSAQPQTKSDLQPGSPRTGAALYTWGNKAYAEEWLIMHTPSRWLPPAYPTWDDLLTAAVSKALADNHAPADLSKWRYGQFRPIDIEHPVYSQSPILQRVIGLPTSPGLQPQSGDDVTVKQVGRSFGPSERFTADLSDFDHSTLNLVLGESSNPLSAWFMDQWPAWYHGTTFPLPFSHAAVDVAATHTLTLTPR
ncbi:penicillin acylase family protein [Tunturibacter empetritectus]|uniref:Penicillin amidase n=1 Tax=Tunturiibacter lichenicola TaxID=2051959 RepID=A0A7W8JAJ4_9BACT|nr:penicillin acylase family protein [Edaphobacter lichenicola]MBB5344427.1 penicillin amidase [Edaphobacter lichenicola]